MEYFVYDTNEDGLEDYLVCLSGIVFEGSHGNSFEIYVQENDGSLKQVFSVTSWIHYEEHSHYPIAILDDSNAGYHTFVLPWVNTIWSYDERDEWYRGRDCRKPTDYDSIFCDAETIFLEIAKNPNTSGEYANIAAGSWFVQAEDYYYLNPEEYFDSIEIIRGETEEKEDGCTIDFMARVYASDKTKDLGKKNPDTEVFQNRKDVKPELQFIGFYDTRDGKFHVSYEWQYNRSALLSAADVKGVSRKGLRMVVPPRVWMNTNS